MASIATVSAAVDRITCRSGGSAQHLFVVKNTSGRPLTVGVRVMPDTPAEGAWFSLEGEAERRLAPEESDQFAVNVRPPAGTAPGPRTFHLLVYDTAAPGEDFSAGPTVSVAVEKPKEPPKPEKKKFPWWIVVVLLVVLGAAAAVIALWPPPSTRVPDLTGQTLERADEALKAASLVRGETVDEAGKPATSGTVVNQSPQGGEEVEQGAAISLVVAVPPARLPDVTGKSEAEAKRLLEAEGLKVGAITRQRSNQVAAGTVMAQDPGAGAPFEPGDKVDLTVAEAVPARLPDVTGKPEAEARRVLAEDGLKVGKTTRQPTREVAAGTVIGQHPSPGAPFKPGDTVDLTVAEAVKVIDLTGVWNSNDNGRCYLRQSGTTVLWYCELAPKNPAWANVFEGSLRGAILEGSWVDVPKGRTGSKGTLRIRVAPSGDEMTAMDRTGGYGSSKWTRAR